MDDSASLSEIYKIALEDEGYQVALAADGAEGLQMISAWSPDLVLLDMMMPEMDGLEVLEALRTSRPFHFPKVIANSGFEGYREAALARGAIVFLAKPLSLDVLLGAVKMALSGLVPDKLTVEKNRREVEELREKSLAATQALMARLSPAMLSDIHQQLQSLVVWIRSYFGFGVSIIHLLKGNELCVEAVYGTGPEKARPGPCFPRKSIYCDDVIVAGSSLYINDPLRHPSQYFSGHRTVVESGWHFYLGVPLVSPGGIVFGTLCLVDRRSRNLRAEDVHLFELLGIKTAELLNDVSFHPKLHLNFINRDGIFNEAMLPALLEHALHRTIRDSGELCVAVSKLDSSYKIAEATNELRKKSRFGAVSLSDGRLVLLIHAAASGQARKMMDAILQKLNRGLAASFEVRMFSVRELLAIDQALSIPRLLRGIQEMVVARQPFQSAKTALG